MATLNKPKSECSKKSSLNKEKTLVDQEKQKCHNLDKVKVGDFIKFGQYPQDWGSKEKKDVEWLVLDKKEDRILIISKCGLDVKPCKESYTEITWEDSKMRKWLNKQFISKAFTKEEQKLIIPTSVPADKNPKCDVDPGNPTEDKVFLLSVNEAERYFKSDKKRVFFPTRYALERGACPAKEGCCWWLRTPGEFSNKLAFIAFYGQIVYEGGFVNEFHDDTCLRPALWINIEA